MLLSVVCWGLPVSQGLVGIVCSFRWNLYRLASCCIIYLCIGEEMGATAAFGVPLGRNVKCNV